ncbi:MAG TPA: hypothetical protein VG871_20550, partial [Vicinamibacterales bacterium]|nr:hypothetical protein [Vicinamibacterales bacterium]
MKKTYPLAVLGAGALFSLSAAAANLVENPDFTSGVDGWTTITAGNGTATLDTTTGWPSAPSIRLAANPADSDVSVSSSCMTLPDSGNVDLYVNIKGTSGVAIGIINTYGDDACTDGLSAINSESFPATGEWATYSMTDVILPEGTRSAKIVLTASASPSGNAGDVNFDHVLFGPTGTVTASVNINQEGLTGTWYNPATSGQGMQLEISPDDGTPGAGLLFGAWYTYDITAGPENSQRWYSFDSAITGDEQSAAVTIYENTGGNFDSGPMTSAVAVGSGTLSFDTCDTGSFT